MWEQHDNYMKQLKQLYNKMSRQTQLRLQEIFDMFNFTSENIYDIADNKTKRRINTYIEQWREQGLLKNNNYFSVLANNIYRRTRVKNSEILELLIYSAYIEEQYKLEEKEKQIMYEDANYYYQEGQKEVDKKKKPSIIPMALFLALLDQPNYSGFTWEQYIQITMQYNAQQIYKQVILNLQQQKTLEINSSEFQSIIKRQSNQKLNINGDKISGATDLQTIGLNNLVKVEGIREAVNNKSKIGSTQKNESGTNTYEEKQNENNVKKIEYVTKSKTIGEQDDIKVRFIAVEDDKTTLMCDSLNNQIFNVHKENVFDRYYGETQKELRLQRIRCNGLVLGLNLPPIQWHFHYCRSTIMYLPPVEKQEKTEYNLDIPKISKEVKQILGNAKLNFNVKRLFNKYLTNENAEIKNNLDVPMRYSIGDDKIYINPTHPDFKYYDLPESLSHEIIHMIDIRNNISDKLHINSELRRARLQIDMNKDKYIKMLSSSKYEDNMTLSDIFSAITNSKISGNYNHSSKYWLEDVTRVKKELSANIMSAYLTNNKDTLDIINRTSELKEIKEKVVKLYNDYTK